MSDFPKQINISITTATILKVIFVAATVLALLYLRDIILVFLASVVIASAVEPGTQWLVRRKVPRFLSVVLIYAVIIACVIGILYLVIPQLIIDVSGFVTRLPQDVTNLTVHPTAPLSAPSLATHPAPETLGSESVGQAVQGLISRLSSASGSVLVTLTTIFGGATSFVLVVVISFYLAVQKNGIEDFLRLVIPLRQEEYVISLWRRTQHKIGKWMQGQLLLAVLIGVLVFIGLVILRVEHAFLFALISMVLEIIPILGPVLGAVPGVLGAYMQGGLTFAIVIAGLYLVIQQIENHIVYPIVVKKVIDIHPLVVIISLIIGVKVGGILGALLSVPVAVALTEFMDDVNKNRVAARERMTTN